MKLQVSILEVSSGVDCTAGPVVSDGFTVLAILMKHDSGGILELLLLASHRETTAVRML